MEKFVKEVSVDFPCRTKLLSELYQLFGHDSYQMPSSIYLYGAPGVGKTTLLMKTLKYLRITHALIDCIEFYSAKMLYEGIMNIMHNHSLSQNNNFENYATCDSSERFIEELSALDKTSSYVIVLKNFERLRDVDANVLQILMRLNELVPELNICCALIGCKATTLHASAQGLNFVYNMHCEQYSKTDLLQILSLQMEHLERGMKKLVTQDETNENTRDERLAIIDGLGIDFYSSYFSIFLDTFHGICRNVKELLYLSNANFPIYCRPVIDGLIKKNDVRKLWKHMELPFKTAMGTIYCRVDQKNFMVVSYSTDLVLYIYKLCNEKYY